MIQSSADDTNPKFLKERTLHGHLNELKFTKVGKPKTIYVEKRREYVEAILAVIGKKYWQET